MNSLCDSILQVLLIGATLAMYSFIRADETEYKNEEQAARQLEFRLNILNFKTGALVAYLNYIAHFFLKG
ncbi:MAG: hypothetical protein CMH22_16655 [Methylophaga sp.]|nr:hypothetical protein [Methylophaga sp.]